MDLHIAQGADYTNDFPITDDQGRARTLVGWTAKAAIRHAPGSPLVHEPHVQIRPGMVRLTIPGHVSAAWTWRRSSYQIELRGPRKERERLAAGRVIVDPTLVED